MAIISGLLDFLRKESFNPGLAGVVVNPFYFIRRELSRNVRSLAPQLSGRLLDFGCGRKPYEHLFSVAEYIGIDMEQTGHDNTQSKVDVYYDGKTIPFADGHFDSVFCSEVLEHVFNLDVVMVELRRVLKADGKMLITVPFCWNEHEVPYDFARYTSFGMRHILETNGFEVLEFRKSGDFAGVNFQLWNLYWYSLINTGSAKLNYVLRMLFISPVNVIGSFLLLILPKNESMYFNNVVLARKIAQ